MKLKCKLLVSGIIYFNNYYQYILFYSQEWDFETVKIEIFYFIDSFLINPVKIVNHLYTTILIIAQLIEL